MKLSLSRMLFLIGILFAVLLLSCVVLLGALFGRTAADNDLELRRTLLQNSAAQISYELDNAIESVRALSVREIVQSFAIGTPLDKYRQVDALRNTFNDFVQFKKPITHLQLRLSGGQTLAANTYGGIFIPEYAAHAKLVEALNLDSFHTGVTRKAVLQTDTDALLAIAVPVEDKLHRRLGSMVIVCSVNNLADHLMEDTPYLIESGGQILYASSEELAKAWSADSDTLTLHGSLYSTLCQPIRETDWQLVSVYRPTSWYGFLFSGLNTLGVCLLAVALVSFSLWLIYRKIVEPIENLAVQIDSVTAADGLVTNLYSNRNEITRLVQGVNTMNSRIRRLNEDVLQKNQQLYRMKLMQMSERILLLQSQLNPHFLYNNLECIRGMACLSNMEGIRDMTVHMARIYRYCVRGGLSTVGEEIDCIRSYLSIIELRYGPVYTLRCEIEHGLEGVKCPRMILQPLIENAVLHGFVREKRCTGVVAVDVRMRDGALIFEVEDDGIGMDAEKMRCMNAEFQQNVTEDCDDWNNKIGLYNVNYRLKLIGGPNGGVFLRKGAAGGLNVRLVLPRSNDSASRI